MSDRPPRQLPPRPDPGAADTDTQVDMGWVEPQPEPPSPEGLDLQAVIEADGVVETP
ncbi:MAG TPA: hypothetical protein VK698_39760 [Kofleriaceae bacterium]|nr:hypothetical protein [Kofleriaceae bacterium]